MENLFLLTLITLVVIMIPVLVVIIQKENKYIAELEKWHSMAMTDELTKIQNRVAYNIHIADLKKTAEISKISLGIILFDIDNFKIINDTNGHLAGDMVLKNVAMLLSEVFKAVNYSVYRIGGDEFAVIAVNSSEKEIINLLLEVKNREREVYEISLSKGYAMINKMELFDEAFSIADKMLYADKAAKKNMI